MTRLSNRRVAVGLAALCVLLLGAAPAGKRGKKPRPAPAATNDVRRAPFAAVDAGVPSVVHSVIPKGALPASAKELAKELANRSTHGTRCGSCHTTAGWSEVSFKHEATGFPLEGRHQRVSCRGCHVGAFETPIARQCTGCHLDAHAGELGQRCESCHDERDWHGRLTAEAHRRTNFPLLGGHAVLPCGECHGDQVNSKFLRPAVPCAGCHAADAAKTIGSAIDHTRLAFGDNCVQCHSGVRFKPARLATHDTCFFISAGPHANIACVQCHVNQIPVNTQGACTSRTAACTSCHTHECTGPGGSFPTDRAHQNALGYQCRDAKCLDCHPSGLGEQ